MSAEIPERAAAAAALREFADLIDRGPESPLHKSVFSALARERADDWETGRRAASLDSGGPG